jgi:Fe-S-cluster containining protein
VTSEKRTLPVLPELPAMRCDDGCGQCCAEVFPVSEAELERVVLYANEHGLEPRREAGVCLWYQEGRCAVYEARPMVCRVFGHLGPPFQQCPRGYNTNVEGDELREVRRVMAEKGAPVRYMQEVLEDDESWKDFVDQRIWDNVNAERARAGLTEFAPRERERT